MTTFIVEGRKFNAFQEAVTFAQAKAAEEDRSVDIKCDMQMDVTRVERKWVARMHPPGFQRVSAMDSVA